MKEPVNLSPVSQHTTLPKEPPSASWSVSSRPISSASYDSATTCKERPYSSLNDRNRARLSVLPTIFDGSPLPPNELNLLRNCSSNTICDQEVVPSQLEKKPFSVYSSKGCSRISLPFDNLNYPPESEEVKNTLGGTRYHIASEFVRLTPVDFRSQHSCKFNSTYNYSDSQFNSQLSLPFHPRRSIYDNSIASSIKVNEDYTNPASITHQESHYSFATTVPPKYLSPRLPALDLHTLSHKPSDLPPTTSTPPRSLLSGIPTGCLYFAGGILFFPLWYIGSFQKISPSSHPTLGSKSERVQREWRNWNRAMALTCTIFLIVLIILGVYTATL